MKVTHVTPTGKVTGANWTAEHVVTETAHTHPPEEITGTAVVSSDSRLSDARTPLAHSHSEYQATSEKGQANGYASLGSDGKVPAGQLPVAAGSESEVIVRITGDVSNATTSFADVTGLGFTADAGCDYLVEADILYTTSATTVGINLAVNGPASPNGLAFSMLGCSAAATLAGRTFNAYNTSGGTMTAAVSGLNIAHMKGIFRNGSNTGTLIVRFAAETTGTVTVKAGSIIRYRRVS